MAKGSLSKEFGSILGKAESPGKSGASADIIQAIKANDPRALKLALKLFLAECGVYEDDEDDEDDSED